MTDLSMKYSLYLPSKVRQLIRRGEISSQTSGMCPGYVQANLVVLPKENAYDFLLFTQRNPKACPVLEVGDTGSRMSQYVARGADIATDIPRYRIYTNGVLKSEITDVSHLWRDDFVYFLLGCSFSFESMLLESGISVRHIEEHRNVPMYNTNILCKSAGIFKGNMVVSMRPIPCEQVAKAVTVTDRVPSVHGAPIHIGSPEKIGIFDINRPDYGDSVTIKEGELPVFWPCGVTPQNVVMNSAPPLVITHSPGHMFITDVKDYELRR